MKKKYTFILIALLSVFFVCFFTYQNRSNFKLTNEIEQRKTQNNSSVIVEKEKIIKKKDENPQQKENTIDEKKTINTNLIVEKNEPKENIVMTKERIAYEKHIKTFPHLHRKKIAPKIRKAKGKGLEKDPKPQPQTDRPDLALEHEFLYTHDPQTNTISYEKLTEARQKVKDYFRQKGAIPNVQWIEKGPNNVGGRSRAMMFDPNDATNKKLWVGSSSGGVWYTNDITTNATFTKVNDFWATLGVSALAYHPTNTQTFYAGTGDSDANVVRGAGIWRSDNAGTTWNQMMNTTAMTIVHDIKFREVSGTVEMYVGANNGLWRSTNGGTNFSQITLPNNVVPKDIEIGADNRIYIGTTSQGIILYSDSGNSNSWTVNDFVGSRVELAVAPSDANVIYAVASGGSGSTDVGFFKKSIDKGVTWTDIPIPMYLNQNCSVSTNHFTRGQAWYDLILLVDPTNANTVLVGGIDIHRSTDGGNTWNSVSYWTGGCRDYVHADQHGMISRPNNPNQAVFAHDGGLSYSANVFDEVSTPAFDDRITNYNVTQYYAVAMKNTPNSNYMLAGAQDNGTHKFPESGSQTVSKASGGDGAFCFIDQVDGVIQSTSYVYNAYYLSKNSGGSFNVGFGSGDAGKFINPTDYDNTSKILYYAGNNNELRYANLTSANPTETIKTIAINGVEISAVKANTNTANRIFIGTEQGRVYRVDNANDVTPVLTNITGTINGGTISSIEIGNNDNELLVVLSNFGVASVYYSNDGGTTWINKDLPAYGLPNMPIRWGIFNPSNTREVLLATDLGVWSTTDITAANPGWEPTNQNLANVRCDMLRIRSSDKLVAVATHGRGVFTTQAFQQLAADFNVDKRISYVNTDVIFTNNSSQANAWNWNFSTNATPTTANTVGPHPVQYSLEGKKSPSLSINNLANTLVTKQDFITILPNRNLSYTLANGGDFETNANDFANEPISTSCAFEKGNSTINGKNGTASGSNAWVLNLNNATYPDLGEARLYTPNFNFSTNTTYTLSFKAKFSFENNYDGFIIEYSTNKGTSWTQLGSSVAANWYNGTKLNSGGFLTNTAFFTGASNGFETKNFNVSFLSGNSNVAFRFVFKSDESDNSAGVAIDDFTIIGTNLPVQLVTLSPPNLNVDVLRNSDLVMTFDKNMQKGTGNITIKKISDNSTVQTIAVSATNVIVAANIVTINQNVLDYGTQYYIEVQNGALKDINNNNYAGFSGNGTWKFTTIANLPAQILTLNPANLSNDVSITTNLAMTFSKNMQKGIGNITIKKVSDNTVVQIINVNNINVTSNVVTITQNSLDYATAYYVEVDNGALKDVDNNNYAGFVGNVTWSFTTISQTTNPSLVSLGNIGQLDVVFNKSFNDFAIKTNNTKFTNATIKIFDMKGTLVNSQNLLELYDNTSLNMKNYVGEGYIVVIETAQGGKTKKVYKNY
ncbi:MAG: hypothetical protein EAZ44_06175 [Cytophagia bacterium]|nr:MAG: hypothetical protein EAZ44_06175 [Cytophagia bacterium]TAG43363.1 MAG: hypothetical protein EAZ31_04490 [Cytophagia bacterium]